MLGLGVKILNTDMRGEEGGKKRGRRKLIIGRNKKAMRGVPGALAAGPFRAATRPTTEGPHGAWGRSRPQGVP